MTTVASAPGKLMLAGEYAVAAGDAPAIACAVNRRLVVRCSGGEASWTVTSGALGLERVDVDAVPHLRAVVERFAPPGSGGHLEVESALGVGAAKPGLGSSAALVVAASAAVRQEFGASTPSLEELVACHQAGQGGGSGYDVATALLGGVCFFQKEGDSLSARSVDWPEELVGRVLNFGAGVSSSGQLRKLERALAARPAEVGAALDAQCAAAVAVAGALESQEPVLSLLVHHERTLLSLDRVADLGIESERYRGVVSALGEREAFVRTAGAGAGDSAWIFARSARELDVACASLVEAGFELLDIGVGGAGLHIQEGAR